MRFFYIILIVIATILLILLLGTFICFRMAFYSPKRKNVDSEKIDIPPGEIYEPFRDTMTNWILEARKMHKKELTAFSFDGLKLFGNYFEFSPDSPIELMFPGYHGVAERDLCGGVQRCFSLGRSALIVDQRGCGKSEGNVITFGINESRDVLSWLKVIEDNFGKDRKVILTGISMGAATVLTASDLELPENVVGIIADCGFTSPQKIIKKVIRDMKLPADLLYPLVRLGALIYGHFNLEKTSAEKAIEKCSLPVFFAHGTKDDYVPFEMSVENYNTCKAPKKLFAAEEAGHGLAYLVAPEDYISALKEIEKEYDFKAFSD